MATFLFSNHFTCKMLIHETKYIYYVYNTPPLWKKEKFNFFAADNVDFAEDTADGKNTTHGTVTVVYQGVDTTGDKISPPLCVNHTKSQSLHKPLSYTHSALSEAKA